MLGEEDIGDDGGLCSESMYPSEPVNIHLQTSSGSCVFIYSCM